jgi:hypothetical protein
MPMLVALISGGILVLALGCGKYGAPQRISGPAPQLAAANTPLPVAPAVPADQEAVDEADDESEGEGVKP